MNTEELLQILACPKCRGDLLAERVNDRTVGFQCPVCQVVYPVRDNIPVMLIEEAIPIKDWTLEK